MPPFLRFLITRLLSVPVTLLIITLALYGFVMLTPPETRATLYMSSGVNPDRLSQEQIQMITERIIRRYHLRDPYPVQYAYWALNLAKGDWGWSPMLKESVLHALVRRSGVTAELTIYALLLFIPLGLASGVVASWNQNRRVDNRFRLAAFTATNLPPFIVALVLLSVFYVMIHWFPPERLSLMVGLEANSSSFKVYTGLMTIDGFLNGRPDISLDALRHLVLPVITVSLVHWATLGRVTRAAMIEEFHKEYLIAAKARGISNRKLVWRHAFRNALTPALASGALSAAALFTGVFVVERIFNFKGISELAVSAAFGTPDASVILGFAVYSVIIVLIIMLVLDIVQAVFDPRAREGILSS